VPNISLVFPVFNEAGLLQSLIDQARAALRAAGCEPRIVLVDYGSTDAGLRVMRQLAAIDPLIKIVQHERNQGYGAAVRSGLLAAETELIAFSDADLQFDLSQLSRLVQERAARGASVVVGYRSPRVDPWHRRVYGRAWTALVNLLLGVRVRDVNCAFKLMTSQARDALRLAELNIDGPGINAALFARWKAAGIAWVEVPVTHLPRPSGRQTGGSLRAIGRGFSELLRLRSGQED